MKRYIRSSSANKYTDRYEYDYKGDKFVIYSKYSHDPYNFQCQITEVHPYDLAEYRWILLDTPGVASVIDNGKRIAYIDLPEFDEDNYESGVGYPSEEDQYIDEIIDYMIDELSKYNANIEPKIDHT